MGWDIVAIGINHSLPIDNPKETAKILSKLVDGKISIGYYQFWEYDKDENTIHYIDNILKWNELSLIDTGRKGQLHLFEIINYCEKHIASKITSIDDVTFDNEDDKKIFFNRVYGKPFDRYALYSNDPIDKNSVYLRIFDEIVDFEVHFDYGRWFDFVNIFREPYIDTNREKLDNFRKYIFLQLKICGCDCAYYFPDQSYGDLLCDEMNRSSEDWVSFMKSRSYFDEEDDDDEEENIILEVKDYVNGKKILLNSEYPFCLIDDFSDLKKNVFK